jgi:galactokinase
MANDISFHERFSREPTVITRSPGRVNLIGDHTDYNMGFVLPFAIDKYTKLAAAPRTDRTLRIHSETAEETIEFKLDGHIGPLGEESHWGNYARGVAWWMAQQHYTPVGADVLVWGDLPVGAGLSSSASLLMGLIGTMSSLSGWNIPRGEMARAAQKIENEFIGVPTGIMDQTAIGTSEPGSALLIDCRSMSTHQVPLNLDAHGLSMVVINSGIVRDLTESAYERRQKECEASLGALKVITYDLSLRSLRDVSMEMLSSHGSKLYPTLYKRARHVVTENERVLQTVSALGESDYETVGQLMNDSHVSLKNDFEVSNAFMDKLVELAQQEEGTLGARMTGGGFGGCTVNLVPTANLRSFTRNVTRRYAEETSLHARAYIVKPSAGLEIDML